MPPDSLDFVVYVPDKRAHCGCVRRVRLTANFSADSDLIPWMLFIRLERFNNLEEKANHGRIRTLPVLMPGEPKSEATIRP